MRLRNVPLTGPRYWTGISIASVFGANLGDFVSRDLHMGHASGLPILALALVAILVAERRSRTPSEVYYWLGIVVVRTAATNLADLATHDAQLSYPMTAIALAVLLVALVAGLPAGGDRRTLPATGVRYWTSMLAAGTLGTVLGDGLTDGAGFGLAPASLALAAVFAAILGLRSLRNFALPTYWPAIVAARTAGTTAGDWAAHSAGLDASTAISGLLLVAALAWRPHGAGRPAETAGE